MNRTRVLLLLSTLIFLTSTAIVYASGGGVVPCDGPDCRACDIITLGQNLLTWFIGIMAAIIALMFAWGGMEMVMSAGNASMVSSGREKMSNAVIGLIIVLSAWLIVNTVILVISGGNLSNWGQIQCVDNPSRITHAPAVVVGGTSSTGGTTGGTAGTLTDIDARNLLNAANISVNKTIAQGTSLEGINAKTINNAIDLKNSCNCTVIITGGTETTGGHSTTGGHLSGNKYDAGLNPQLNSYIENSGWTRGVRNDAGGVVTPTYTAPNGTVYAKESTHWDVLVP